MQMYALIALCMEIDDAYEGRITFHGHNEVNPMKACPVFNYQQVLRLDPVGHLGR